MGPNSSYPTAARLGRAGMLEDGIYGLDYRAPHARDDKGGSALAVLRDGKILGSDPWGGLFTGLYDYDTRHRLNKVRLRFDVPPEGVLVTGFCAGPAGATLDIVGAFERTAPTMATVVEVSGVPVEVQLTYLGPLPSEKPNGRPAPCGNER